MTTSGRTLKLERVAADVQVGDLAARMGISRQTLSTIEAREKVEPVRVDQYREALKKMRDGPEASRAVT